MLIELLITLLVMATTTAGLIYPALFLLAKLQMFFVVWTEGKSIAIIKGGELVRFVGGLDGYYQIKTQAEADAYNTAKKPLVKVKKWSYVPLDPGQIPPARTYSHWLWKWMDEKLGLIWIGIYPSFSVYWYTLRALTMEVGQSEPRERNERSCYIYLKQTLYYASVIYRSRENISFKYEYVFYLAGVNPFVAMFENGDWFGSVTARLNAWAVMYFGSTPYDKVNVVKEIPADSPSILAATAATSTKRKSTVKIADMSFSEFMAEIGDEIERDFGFRLGPVMVIKKGPVPNDKVANDFVDSFSANQIAQQVGDAKVTAAKLAADERIEEGRGEADYTEKTMEAKAKGIRAELTARAEGAKKLVEAFDGDPEKMRLVLNAETSLALVQNPHAKIQMIAGGGSGSDGVIGLVTAGTQAVLNQLNENRANQATMTPPATGTAATATPTTAAALNPRTAQAKAAPAAKAKGTKEKKGTNP